MVRYSTVRYGTVRYGTVRYGTVRYGMEWYFMVCYGTDDLCTCPGHIQTYCRSIINDMICYGVLWCVMVCYGMLWYVMVCYGMLWYVVKTRCMFVWLLFRVICLGFSTQQSVTLFSAFGRNPLCMDPAPSTVLPVEVRCYISYFRCLVRNTRCNTMSHLTADAVSCTRLACTDCTHLAHVREH